MAEVDRNPHAAESPDANRPRVLLAEDDDTVRFGLTALLESMGFDVFSVPDGAALLEQISSGMLGEQGEPPDVIVTDVRMPGFNALNIVEGLRDLGWHTPVIVITAFGDAEMRARVDRIDDLTLFDKPIDLERLEQTLKEAVKRNRARSTPTAH